jgi:tetratricopeptide (TPR) repeat protein
LLLVLAAGRAAGAGDPFDHFYNLEYDEAIDALRAIVRQSPGDARFRNELAQALLYREMYRSGELDSELVTGDTELVRRPHLKPSPEVLDEIESSIRAAIAIAEQHLADHPGDVATLFELGVAHEASASVNFFIHKAWLKGLRDAARARRLHDRVAGMAPAFADSRLIPGAHDYLISQLPLAYKMVGAVIGFRGNKKEGIRAIEAVARDGDRRRVSAQMLLAAIYRREKQPDLAVPLLVNLVARFPRNHLFPVELAQMYADAGDMAAALRTLDGIEEQIRSHRPGFTRLTVDQARFLRGHIQFRRGLLAEAAQTLRSIADRGDQVAPETRALVWLRLGQLADLRDQREAAQAAYRESIAAQPVSDGARRARLFLLSPYRDKPAGAAVTDAEESTRR